MKLHLELVERFVDLPTSDPAELRQLFNDLIGEVKDLQGEGAATVYTIETLANRGDHLHVLGCAREVSARTLAAVKLPAVAAELSDRKSSVPLRVETDGCLRYGLLELRLPGELKLRPEVARIMESCGDRHPIVDLLNFVQLEIGQPMHAFDQDKIAGEIKIDRLERSSKIEALDGQTYTVPADAIVIRDQEKIVAVAGVIGCANSMVGLATKKVLIESAAFDPVSVRKAARSMGLSTDASKAFERGADLEGVLFGLKRLVFLAGGGSGVVGGSDGVHAVGFTLHVGKPTEKREVTFSIKALRQQLGLPRLGDVEITSRLKHLGFGINRKDEADSVTLTVPSWRLWDVQNAEDIVEEVARAISYSKVKLELPALDYEFAAAEPMSDLLSTVEPVLVGHGFSEVMTRSYYSAAEVAAIQALDPDLAGQHLALKNSQESGYSHLRITMLVHHARLFEEHRRRGVHGFKAFEFARNFSKTKDSELYDFEHDALALSVGGRWFGHEWRKSEGLEQMFSLLRGTIESIFGTLYCKPEFVASEHKLLHPGIQAAVRIGRTTCGVVGQLHPALQESLGLREPLLFAEFHAEKLAKVRKSGSLKLPVDLPMVRRDLTLKLPLRELAGSVVRWINDSKLPNLIETTIVDDFRKTNEDFRRTSFRLTFQNPERTLESGEIDAVMTGVLERLKGEKGIELAG